MHSQLTKSAGAIGKIYGKNVRKETVCHYIELSTFLCETERNYDTVEDFGRLIITTCSNQVFQVGHCNEYSTIR